MCSVRERRHRNTVRDHALFALLANTGIRPSEALAIRRGDVRSGVLRVVRKKTGTALVADTLRLTDELSALIQLRLVQLGPSPDARLFPICSRTAQRIFKRHAVRCGLGRRVRLYVLRHTAATRIYRATRNIAVVQAMLGHKSADTSAIYAHIPADVLRDNAKAFQGA